MEMTSLKSAAEFVLECIGGLTVLFGLFGFILYKLLIINHVAKEQEESFEEEPETHFIDELYQQ